MGDLSQKAVVVDYAKQVQQAIQEKGVETPILIPKSPLEENQRLEKLEYHFSQILQLMHLDLDDDSLQGTPKRLAKMYAKEVFLGLDYANFPEMTLIENKISYVHPLIVDKIVLRSFCEHHFVPISGFVKVAYLPGDTLIGLSKINRIVNFFASRPQVQERLTQQISVALQNVLNTENIGVTITATHHCVLSRGVKDAHSETTTYALSGQFKEKYQSIFIK